MSTNALWEPAETTAASIDDAIAATTHAASDKATPVDADEMPLVDSAASWTLKKLTWANIKVTLSSVFAVLAGKTGGQTLIGGTGVTDKLVLKGTSGNGTSTEKALEVLVGNNGATSALTVLNDGKVGIGKVPTQALHVEGVILATTSIGTSGVRIPAIWVDALSGPNGLDVSNDAAGMSISRSGSLNLSIFKNANVIGRNPKVLIYGATTTVTADCAYLQIVDANYNFKIQVNNNSANLLLNPDKGNIGLGTALPSAKAHAVSTTEQLRLGYDASNYASFTVDAAGNLTLGTTGTTPSVYTATLRSGVKVTPVTTTASPAATDSGTVYTNEGDADGATITLPTAVAGLQFTAYVQTAQTLTITAGSGDTIRMAGNVTAAAGSITSATVGSAITLTAINATEWVAVSSIGSWTI